MSGIVTGNTKIERGQIVAWRTIIGERRGRVAALRANGTARVELYERVKGLWQPTEGTADIELPLLRPLLAARVSFQDGSVEAKAGDAVVDLFMYGDIGSGRGIDAPMVEAALRGKPQQSRLNVFLSSPGGNPLEAVAIASILNRWRGETVVYIDGLAASAATIVAVAARRTYMAAEAMFMIHRAWTMAVGDRDELLATLEVLDQIDEMMANAYVRRTGKSKSVIMEMMAAETWMNAEEAKANGFVDAIVTPPKRNANGAQALLNRPWFTRNPDGTVKPLSQAASSISSQTNSQPAPTASAPTVSEVTETTTNPTPAEPQSGTEAGEVT